MDRLSLPYGFVVFVRYAVDTCRSDHFINYFSGVAPVRPSCKSEGLAQLGHAETQKHQAGAGLIS